MFNTPLLKELEDFNSKNYIKFFMPGHNQLKYKADYTNIQKEVFNILDKFKKNIYSYDVTEIANFDNLSQPQGIIKESEKNVSHSFKAGDAFFLVNGSTTGVLSMIFAVTNYNDKIIIQKNSHKSVHNACKIKKLKIAYIQQNYNQEFDIYNKLEIKEIKKAIDENKDAKAILITSPDYFGNDQDIENIAKLAHENNMYLLVDAAHSAHYPYSNMLPKFALENGADIAVASFHKTLPCFNQTAVLFLNKTTNLSHNDVLQSVNIFQTTSPSYVFLSSIELSDNILKKYGEKLYSELIENIIKFKSSIKNLSNIKILQNDDITRIVIGFENIDMQEAYDILTNKYKILPEMINKKSMVFIANIFHTREEFEKLSKAIKEINLNKKSLDREIESRKFQKKEEIISYLKSKIGEKIEENIYIYPPGTPLIAKGEKITKKHIEKLNDIRNLDSIDVIK